MQDFLTLKYTEREKTQVKSYDYAELDNFIGSLITVRPKMSKSISFSAEVYRGVLKQKTQHQNSPEYTSSLQQFVALDFLLKKQNIAISSP